MNPARIQVLAAGWVVMMAVGAGAVPARADIPDPSLSSFTFPDSITACESSFSVSMQINGAGGPIAGARVLVEMIVVSGTLDPGSPTIAEGSTDASGNAVVTFAGQIRGDAVVYFEVFANEIKVFESRLYEVGAECPVPVREQSWGLLKRSIGKTT